MGGMQMKERKEVILIEKRKRRSFVSALSRPIQPVCVIGLCEEHFELKI